MRKISTGGSYKHGIINGRVANQIANCKIIKLVFHGIIQLFFMAYALTEMETDAFTK